MHVSNKIIIWLQTLAMNMKKTKDFSINRCASWGIYVHAILNLNQACYFIRFRILFAISVVRVFSGNKCNLLNHCLPEKHLFDYMYSKISKRKTRLEPSESKINSKLFREKNLSFSLYFYFYFYLFCHTNNRIMKKINTNQYTR